MLPFTLADLMTVLLAVFLSAFSVLIFGGIVAVVFMRRRRRRKGVARNEVEMNSMDREKTRAGLVDYYIAKLKGIVCSRTYV